MFLFRSWPANGAVSFSLLAAFCFFSGQSAVEPNTADEIKKIESVLTAQDACWNRGDIEGFMDTYWKSDELTFSSGGNTTRGWKATLDRYKKNYPRDKMGKLHFDELETSLQSESVALVLGRWHLDLNGEKKDGNFSLVMKKVSGEWKIVHDHSSTLEKEKGWLTIEQAKQVGRSHLPGEDGRISYTREKHFLVVTPLQRNNTSKSKETIYVDRMTGVVTREKPATLRATDEDN